MSNQINIITPTPSTDMKQSLKKRMVSLKSSLWHVMLYVVGMCMISGIMNAQDCSQVSLSCNGSVNVSTNESCEAEITVALVLQSSLFGFQESDFSITLRDEQGNLIPGTTIGDTYVNTRIKASVSLDPCGLNCWGYLNIEDKIGPKFDNCAVQTTAEPYGFGSATISCEDLSNNVQVDVPFGSGILTPTLVSTCSMAGAPTFEDESMPSCTGEYSALITRTWLARDNRGNATTCKQLIRVLRQDLETVTFPANFIRSLEVDECNAYPSLEPEVTGYPTGLNCGNIMFTFTDIASSQPCGVQNKFIRDWLVVDWCTGETKQRGQVIKIIDSASPVSLCVRADGTTFARGQVALSIPSNSFDCFAADVKVDPYGIIDSTTAPITPLDCSFPLKLTVSYLSAIAGTDQPAVGPYKDISIGADSTYTIPQTIERAAWVRYCWEDDCGNGATINTNEGEDPADFTNCCFFEIEVTDNNAPIAICEGFTKVSLNTEGKVDVRAEVFDDGSFDPCGSVTEYEVRRLGGTCPGTSDSSFGSDIQFCCNDLGDTLNVELKIFDDTDNSSTCISRVCVNDAGGFPVISCPATTVNLTCDDDYTDVSQLGTISGVDGCSVSFRVGSDDFNLDDFNVDCNTGTVIRTIIVMSTISNLELEECIQTITLLPTTGAANLLTADDYTFPTDKTIDVCNSNESIDPDQTGYPVERNQMGCSNIAIGFVDSDRLFTNFGGSCYTIVRTWTIIDWCRFNPDNPSEHILTGTQQLTINNTSTPEFTCPTASLAISAEGVTCKADVQITANVTNSCSELNVRYELDLNSDGNVDSSGSGIEYTGNHSVGTHMITFFANNECGGEESSCKYTFEIKGDAPPLPICLASITWTLNEDSEAIVWASDFNLKSQGGCSGLDTLVFSFAEPGTASYPETFRTFTCSDITNGVGASIPLTVYVVDESLDYESCTVILDLQDTRNLCTDVGSMATLGGNITTENEEAVQDVEVDLGNMNNSDVSSKLTSQIGLYAFNNVEYYSDYMVTPHRDVDDLNGVSTLDLVHIQRHILGITQLDSPYKIIAADINNDQKVNGLDLIQLRKLILGVYTELPQNESWVFVDRNFEFSSQLNPWNYADEIMKADLHGTDMDIDFIGVKVGDVNNSVVMSAKSQKVASRSRDNVFLSTQNTEFVSGELVAVPIILESDMDMSGLQFSMDFDHENLVFQGLDSGNLNISEDNFALLNNHSGVITVSYSDISGTELNEGDLLFTVYFESRNTGNIQDMFTINSEVLSSEAYAMDNSILDINFVVTNHKVEVAGEMEVFQNEPNPFNELTNIAFSLPTAQDVTLTVFDANGKLLYQENGSFKKGINQFEINAGELNTSGVLIYRLENQTSSHTKKMILLK